MSVVLNDDLFLVLNPGSSSLKAALFDNYLNELLSVHVDRLGGDSQVIVRSSSGESVINKRVGDHFHASLLVLNLVKERFSLDSVRVVGYRVVHGGELFIKPTIITPEVLSEIKRLSVLAPLHNPPAVSTFLTVSKVLGRAKHVAVFDTSFHHTIKKEAFLYGLPYSLYQKFGLRKYGFHGINHEYVSHKAREVLGFDNSRRIVSCHLGNGSSVTAVLDGRSVDTSMGFSPLDGLIMGTRSGDLDPEIVLFLLRYYTRKQLESLLNKESGFKGLVGVSDMREVYSLSLKGDSRARLVIDMLAYRVAKYVSSYVPVLGGIDVLVFTGGIGENAFYLRRKILNFLKPLGVLIDSNANRRNSFLISDPKSKVKVLVIKANEALAIAKKIKNLK